MKMINDKMIKKLENKIIKKTYKGITLEFMYVKYFDKWYYACETKYQGWYMLREVSYGK